MSDRSEVNRTAIARYHHSIAVGDYDTVIALHAPDVVCWMSGRSIVSGRFQGRDALFDHMRHHVLGPLIVGTEDYVKGTRIIVADESIVVALLHGGLPNTWGGRYDQFYLQVFRMADGIIQEIVELFDTVMFETEVLHHHLKTKRAKPERPFDILPALAGSSTGEAAAGLAERFASIVQAGDWQGLASLLSSEAELAAIGSTPHSGITATVLDTLPTIFSCGVSTSRTICTGPGAAVLLMRAGEPDYAQQYAVVLEIADEKIGRISLFEDTVETERYLYGNPILPAPSARTMPPFDVNATLK